MFLGYYIPSAQNWAIPVKIAIYGDQNHIIGLNFVSINQTEATYNDALPSYFQDIRKILDEYFSKGSINHLDVIEKYHLDVQIKTPFIKKVLLYVCKIPTGQVKTYGEVGRSINCKGARAIGMALRSNSFPIFIPCHRVIGKTSLGGFMGATYIDGIELKIKETLLRLEGWHSS